jgi:DNA-binding NarL/FixJ family response regulator
MVDAPAGSRNVSVLIVDDQMPFRQAASRMVARMDGFEVVGQAESGEQAVDLAALIDPQLVIMDVRLAGMSGAEAARRIVELRPDTVVVLVSTYRRADLPREIDDCGAVAFLRKEEFDPDILRSLCGGAHEGPDRPPGRDSQSASDSIE